MRTYCTRYINSLAIVFVSVVVPVFGKTIVFFEKTFPVIENSVISRTSLERAFATLDPRFVSLSDQQKNDVLAEGDLLVMPYGSALPADAWETIQRHLR